MFITRIFLMKSFKVHLSYSIHSRKLNNYPNPFKDNSPVVSLAKRSKKILKLKEKFAYIPNLSDG